MPLSLVSPIITPPFLDPPSAYAFAEARVVAFQLTKDVQLLLAWMRGTLKAEDPGVPRISVLDIDRHFTGVRMRLWRNLVA